MDSPVPRSDDGDDSQPAKDYGKEGTSSEKEKENKEGGLGVKVKRKSKRGRSSGSLTMKGDKITSFTTDRQVTYQPLDHVYIENNKPNQPYFICSIQEFSVIKRDTLVVKVKWYYRVSELPDSVFQHLVQDRYTQHVDSDHPLSDPKVKSRELFCSEATDTYPVTALRGKCKVVHCNSLEAARTFKPAADTFYCILGYNPETKRLATTQGQIRVGSMYQARMPECRPNTSPSEMPERCEDREDFKWQPKGVVDGDLMMFLRAARSVAAFAGMCDGGSTEDGCQAASMDDTTMNAMHVLHRYEYDTGKALQSLVKAPALRTIDKKWNEEDTKKFVKGLRVYGKNFFKIRKELLPYRETGELVEYYYYWKKTPAAAANRPHRRHRRHGVKRATTRSQRPASSEFLDLSSSGDSDNDSEDSDGVTGFRCQNCLVTVSKDWSNAGKSSTRLCTKCRIFFKKYGVDRPVDGAGDSPYFQPVKDGDITGPHSMLTRQNHNSTDPKDKKKGPNSVSSLDSPCSDSKKSLIPSSPSAVSTCSNSSTDREKKKRRSSVSPGQDKKRHHQDSDSEDKYSKQKLTGPSDSESVSDSSISGAEETPNDGDVETNQDELTSSSPPSTPTPSPVESDYNKRDKTTPVPIPVESSIADKLSHLPRPEPQHPSPNRQPLETPTLIPQLPVPPLPRQQLPVVPQIPSQGFVPLPPLPAFAFRPQGPLSDSLYPRSPFSEPLPSQKHSPVDREDHRSGSSSAAESGEDKSDTQSHVIANTKVKEEVLTPPPSPKPEIIKQDHSASFMSAGQCAGPAEGFRQQKEHFEMLTPKLEPGTLPPSSNPPPGVGVISVNPAINSTSHRLAEPTLSSQSMSSQSLTSQAISSHPLNSQSLSSQHLSAQSMSSLHSSAQSMSSQHSSSQSMSSQSLTSQHSSSHSMSAQALIPQVEVKGHPVPPPLPSQGLFEGHRGEGHRNIEHRGEGHRNIEHRGEGHRNIEHRGEGHRNEGHRSESHRNEGHRSESHRGEGHRGEGHRNDGHRVEGHRVEGHRGDSQDQSEEKRPEEVLDLEMEDSDSDREGTLTPGPVPTACNKEIHRSKTGLFLKVLNRGEHNSCSRCDLIFKPLVERKEVERKKLPTPSTPHKEETKRKTETPPPNPTADAQVISNIPPPHHTHQDRVTPRSYPDTPALRQLSEYAKPHALGQDPRAIPGGYLGYPFMDPIRMSAIYPPNSRERLELELERDKRERDARERELREQELRSMEMRDKLKAELEMKPPGLERLLPPGANPLDPHWLEIQRRYGPPHMLPGGSGSNPHIPGLYPPTSIATDLMARERERLERLGIPPGHPMLADPSMYTAAIMERLSAERLSAERFSHERLSAERHHAERLALQDPLIRLQMAGMPGAAAAAAAAAAQHAHTHTHAHSHTHLHLHQPDQIPGMGPGPPIPTSSGLHYPLLPPHLLPPGADPMAGVNGASNQTPPTPGSHPSLPVGLPPPLLASREQEQLLQNDLYRRAYQDPALAQQLQAHHEAIQRMVMDRERFGSGHLPPPH